MASFQRRVSCEASCSVPCSSVMLCSLLLLYIITSAHGNDKFDKLYDVRNEAAQDVAVKMARALAPSAKCRASRNCNQGSCVPSTCANEGFGDNLRCSGLLLASNRESICPNSCSPEKRLLDFETPFLTFTPGSVRYEKQNDTINIRIENLELLRDACALKSMRDSLPKSFDKHKLKSWLYASTSSGLFLFYPGNPRKREKADIDKCGYVPMDRPWYIAATSGSKDVVFILDTTSLLAADKVLARSLEKGLKALQRNDYVAVIAADRESKALSNFERLYSATDDVKNKLLTDLERLQPSSGKPHIESALSIAFGLLKESYEKGESSSCSKIIVLLMGNEPKCFDECSSSQAGSEGCRCTSRIVDMVKRQRRTEYDVSIVTFTEGNNNDAQRVARSLVCESSNPGVWSRVSSEQSPDSSLLAYTDIASLTQTREQYTSDVYVDASGLGEMFTIARPVYDPQSQRLVGVVGVDTTIREVAEAVGGREIAVSAVKDKWTSENRGCKARVLGGCELQKLRDRYGGACADVLVENGQPWTCFQAANSLYWRSDDELSWTDAQQFCKSSSSDLAVIDNEGKNKIAASISSLDGSWIGLKASRGDSLTWVSGSQLDENSLGFSISSESFEAEVKALHDQGLVDACVSIDRRGVDENWNVVPCDAKRFALCEIPAGSPNASRICPADAIFNPRTTQHEPFNKVDCDFAGSSTCSDDEEEILREANPLCTEQSTEIRDDFDRQCCGGRSDTGGEKECEENNKGLPVAAIAGSVAGVFIVISAMLVLFCLRMRVRKNKDIDGLVQDESHSEHETNPGSIGQAEQSSPPPGYETMLPPTTREYSFEEDNDQYVDKLNMN